MRCPFLAIERTENSWVNFYLTEKLRCTFQLTDWHGIKVCQSLPNREEAHMEPGITALILICSAGLPKSECTIDTATDMLEGLKANTPIECLMSSEALIAQSALGPGLGKDQYLKVICVQTKRVAEILRLHAHEGIGRL
jgi:hypothetical protein